MPMAGSRSSEVSNAYTPAVRSPWDPDSQRPPSTESAIAKSVDLEESASSARSAPTSGYFLRVGLFAIATLCLAFATNLLVGSRLEEHVAQSREFDRLRLELAEGTAPVGPHSGRQTIAMGTPIALLEIPSIGVREVVDEGTTGSVLMDGPGHMLSTVFPGGVGTSVILGRSAAYGGPFGSIDDLRKGALVKVITGVGPATFRVLDVRKAGDVVPYLPPGKARLTLATASGPAFLPNAVVWVDADLVGNPLAAQRPAVRNVARSQRPLGTDPSALAPTFGWLALMVIVLAAAVWAWYRWGRAQAWLVFSAPVLLVGLMVAHEIDLLLPNLT